MCGITGFFSKIDHSAALKNSLALLHHRGPDGARHVVLPMSQAADPDHPTYLGMGHTRLRIMDTSQHADQPFFSQDKDSMLIFNGEIYNFQVLKDLLPNHPWRTQSDSEVVVYLLNRFGLSILTQLNGMYAMAWYQKSTDTFALIRDPLGIKPLYLHQSGGNIFFASEITALTPFGITPDICKTDLIEFLNFGYIHEPRTGFSNIAKVPPGRCMIWQNGQYQTQEIGPFDGPPDLSTKPNALIQAAIQGQQAADVPVGTFFSGGIDSTAVTAALKSDGLYINSAESPDQNPELLRAKRLAQELGVALDVINLDENLTIDQFRKDVALICAKVEEPISDYTFIASQRIAHLARQKGLIVMLSGMGGDEIFAGYPRYTFLNKLWLYRWVALGARLGFALPKLRKRLAKSKKIERLISYFQEKTFVWAYARVVGYLTKSEITDLLGRDTTAKDRLDEIAHRLTDITKQATSASPLDQALALDQKGFLAHNLTVTDKSSMQESIEVRVPLLDLSLYTSFVQNHKIRSLFPKTGKAPLLDFIKRIFGRPIDFGIKQGFNPPLERIISQFDQDSLTHMILTPAFIAYLQPAPVQAILEDHFAGRMNNTYKIWQLIFISHWLQFWSQANRT